MIMKRKMLMVLILSLILITPVYSQGNQQENNVSGVHPSWDVDGDGINDCELDGSCDHTIDYSKARRVQAKPSFDCSKEGLSSTEILVCNDSLLSILDRKMNQVYGNARYKAKDTMLSTLTAEQRGWLKGRDDCWKDDDQSRCVLDSYVMRIAELQARYDLVKPIGQIHYVCCKSQANEVVITFFQTIPKTLIAERGDSVYLMYLQEDRESLTYAGRNEHLVIDGNMLRLTLGFQQPEVTCYEK